MKNKNILFMTFLTILLVLYHFISDSPSYIIDILYILVIIMDILIINYNDEDKIIKNKMKLILILPLILILIFIFGRENKNANANILILALSLGIIFVGFLTTFVPYNSFLGIRLFSTRNSPINWIKTHKLLAYLSIPSALLLLVLSNYYSIELSIVITFLTWLGIPIIYSIFSYAKRKDI